jgi:hypothetical protein
MEAIEQAGLIRLRMAQHKCQFLSLVRNFQNGPGIRFDRLSKAATWKAWIVSTPSHGGILRSVLAAAKLTQEEPGQTLQATALVHKAYLRLVGSEGEPSWDKLGHYFAAAAEVICRIHA